MQLYNKNMSFIKEKALVLYNSLIGEKVVPDKVEPLSEENNFFISGQGYQVFMHSRYDQERETSLLLEKCPDDSEIIVLLGFGNGKAIATIRNNYPKLKELIVIDPNPEPMLLFLQHTDFRKFFGAFCKVSFIINNTKRQSEAMLGQLIQEHTAVAQKISVIAHISYRTVYSEYCESAMQIIYNVVRSNVVNIATTEKNRYQWLINVWRNLKYSAVDIGCFIEKTRGVPAILVSAGPSLNKNIHLLEQAKSKALIVAVGSAMTILQTHGIVPHLRVAMDPSINNIQLFSKVDTASCPLVYNNRLCHGILPHYEGVRVNMTFPDVDFLERYIFTKLSFPYLPVRSGFSVANSAMDMLIKLKCSKIILVGQDLCYTEGKMHATGSWRENVAVHSESKAHEVTDLFGNRVSTTHAFLAMKSLFEILISTLDNTECINATEGGLIIEGAANKTMAEVLEFDLTKEYDLTSAIQEALSDESVKERDREQQIGAIVETIQGEVSELLIRNRLILRRVEKILQMIKLGVRNQTVQNEIKAVNMLAAKQLRNAFFKEVVYPTFEEKFAIRNNLLDGMKKDGSLQNVAEEVDVLQSNMREIEGYLVLTEQLILEYKDDHELIVQGGS